MSMRRDLRRLLVVAIAAGLGVLMAGCSEGQPRPSAPATATAHTVQATPTDRWQALLETTPFPYTLPLPRPAPTAIDGVYVKQEPLVAEHIPCRRCPDWLNEGGLWKLGFDRGVYRVLHGDLGRRSTGSYVVSGDRWILFNDPSCIGDIGVYAWQLGRGVLTIGAIDDVCAIGLRRENLTHLPWLGCQPPGVEAAVTDHWQRPEGCE